MTFILEADESDDNKDAETPREGDLTPPCLVQEALHSSNCFVMEERPAIQPLSQEESREQRYSAGASPQSPTRDQNSALSLREASLMRCFIQKIAPWVRPEHCYLRTYLI